MCSKVMYDKDILDKMNEINKLKNAPHVEYASLEEWDNTLNSGKEMIKKCINKWVVEDDLEYRSMRIFGLTSRQRCHICDCLREVMNLLTKETNNSWGAGVAHNIMVGVEGFFNGFIDTGNWDIIYSNLEPDTMSSVIYHNIASQLDEHLSEIAVFTCVKCKKKDTYTENGLCYDCDNAN